ncbi:hypothetical protein ADICEAN_03992 [Cesiribacter andamanensis AMV16]|uniref:Uncharacterized protein n=1 Tax=Cesiribacter andamanensis AMV16 TaxID=1279009 RepID=M7N0Q4_9BACT|nr:hypothetical protein ADICEAN_03992 [Cesiribacter andamanensis AMV16]
MFFVSVALEQNKKAAALQRQLSYSQKCSRLVTVAWASSAFIVICQPIDEGRNGF